MEKTFIDIRVIWIQSDSSYRRPKAYTKSNNTQMWWAGFFPSSVKEGVVYAVERHLEPHCKVKSWDWIPLPTHFFLGCGGREMDKRQHKLSTKNKLTHLSILLFLNLLMAFCSRSRNNEIPLPQYSKFPLAICFTYGNINFHDTLSLHLTLSSPLPMSISLFSMSVSPLLACK